MGLQDLTSSANQIRIGLQDLTDKEQQFKHALRGITGLQDPKGKKHQIEHAYEVSGWGCRLSRVRNNMHPDGAEGSHWWGTSDRTCLQLSGRCCRISRVGKYRSYMHTRHQEGTSGSHGFETPDRTCL